MSDEQSSDDITPRTRYQMLPLRDVVVFPHMVLPLFVGREKSINALEEAVQSGKQIFLAAQHDAADDDPAPENIFGIGTVASILQLLKLPDGTVKVLVEGVSRAGIVNYVETEDSFVVDAAPIAEGEFDEREGEVLMRTVTSEFEQYVKLNSKIPPEVLTSLSGIEDPGRLADTIAAHLTLRNDEKQKVLELGDVGERLEAPTVTLANMLESDHAAFSSSCENSALTKSSAAKGRRSSAVSPTPMIEVRRLNRSGCIRIVADLISARSSLSSDSRNRYSRTIEASAVRCSGGISRAERSLDAASVRERRLAGCSITEPDKKL